MNKISTFLMAFILAIGSFLMPAAANPLGANPAHPNMQILLIGGGEGIGTSALSQIIAAHSEATIIVAVSDCDGIASLEREKLVIANKHNLIPMATVPARNIEIQLKTDVPKNAGILSRKTFYNLPPNDNGFSGMSYANPIRAQPAGS